MQYKFYKQSFGFINVARMLCSSEIFDSCPDFVEQDDYLMVIYRLTQSIRSNIFNYHTFMKTLNIIFFVGKSNTVAEACISLI